jgi:hypothetical protein
MLFLSGWNSLKQLLHGTFWETISHHKVGEKRGCGGRERMGFLQRFGSGCESGSNCFQEKSTISKREVGNKTNT